MARELRDTDYAREIATAEISGCRIERLLVKGPNQEEIRFSWWRNGNMANRPLDLPEHELLPLLIEAMRAGVFTADFLKNLHSALYEHKSEVTDAART